MVLPGFHDSHVHLLDGGAGLLGCNLRELSTVSDVLATIRECAQTVPGKTWITGSGWDLPVFPGGNPRKEQLDQAIRDRPAYMKAADGHSGWANSKALAIAGITRNTPDPDGGRIERDAVTKEPTGTLRESAVQLVTGHIPRPTAEENAAALLRGIQEANRFGITSVQDAMVTPEVLTAYKTLEDRGQLTVKTVAALLLNRARGLPELIDRRRSFHGKRLRPTAVKIFADGVIESGTAALLDPYLTRNGSRGDLNFEPQALNRFVAALDREGFQIHIHAIGDRAVRVSLDALAAARMANGGRDARHHIAHLQLIHPTDIPRFRQLGVIANFQPLWAYPDAYIKDLTFPVLGPKRSQWLYAIDSIAKSGATLAAGSDWPVTSLNPLEAIQVAMTRRDPQDPGAEALLREQAVDLNTILAAYTINGAYLNGQEKETGSIETGKAADLIVLDRDLFRIRPGEVHRAKVVLTFIDGKECSQSATALPSAR